MLPLKDVYGGFVVMLNQFLLCASGAEFLHECIYFPALEGRKPDSKTQPDVDIFIK